MNIIKNTTATTEAKRKYVGALIGNVVYNTIGTIEEKAQKQIELGLGSEDVKEIKTKYDSKGEKTKFIASSHAAYEISHNIRENSLIKFLINKLSEDELNKLNTLITLTDMSITDES